MYSLAPIKYILTLSSNLSNILYACFCKLNLFNKGYINSLQFLLSSNNVSSNPYYRLNDQILQLINHIQSYAICMINWSCPSYLKEDTQSMSNILPKAVCSYRNSKHSQKKNMGKSEYLSKAKIRKKKIITLLHIFFNIFTWYAAWLL